MNKRPQNIKATWCKKNFIYGQKKQQQQILLSENIRGSSEVSDFYMSYTSSHLPYLEQPLPNEGPDYIDVLFIFPGHMLRTSTTSSQLESMAVFPAIKLPTLRDATQINGVKVVSIGLESRGEYGWLRQKCGWTFLILSSSSFFF